MALDPVTELEAVIDAFDAAGIAYALCGGLALAVHGHPRATMDIDMLVRAEELPAAVAAAATAGFDVPGRTMTFGLAAGKPRQIKRVFKLDPDGSTLVLDLLVVNDELEPVWDTRETRAADARRLVVVSRSGLTIMKRIAGRPQDLADLAKLEGREHDDEG